MDAALMDRARETGEAVLRVYSWSRPTLTFGRNETVVGRFDPVTELAPDVDLSELDTGRSTSRRHARISERGGSFFVREEIGTANGTFVGADRLIFATDYNHSDSKFPHTVEEVMNRKDLSDGLKAKLMGENAAKLYRL